MSQTAVVTHQKAIRKDNPVMRVIGRVLLYTVLIAMALFTRFRLCGCFPPP